MIITKRILQVFLEIFICFSHEMVIVPLITITLRTNCLVNPIKIVHLLPPFFNWCMGALLSKPIIILKLQQSKDSKEISNVST